DVDPDLGHLLQDAADRGNVRVSNRIEDVVPAEQWFQCHRVQQVELVLEARDGLISHGSASLQGPPVDLPGGGIEGGVVVPPGVADEPGRPIGPRTTAAGGGAATRTR